MSPIEVFNLMSSIVSLILAIISIWLSLYFYNKSKETELNATKALTSIQAQTQSLERLTAKWMDRFTRYATSPRAADETSLYLMQIVKEYSSQTIGTQLKELDSSATKDNLTNELVSSYLILYYYASVANVALQAHLPNEISSLEVNDAVKNLVDSSYADSMRLDAILAGTDHSKLESNVFYSLYQQTIENWKQHTRDTTMYYREKELQNLSVNA